MYVSSTSIELRRARNDLSSPEADVATTTKGSPFATRRTTHQPSEPVVPSATLMFAVENTSTRHPEIGRPVVNDVAHTPVSSPLCRTLSPMSERQTTL